MALRSEEVLELMADEYPKKYEEYQAVLQEREFQAALQRKMMETRKVAMMVIRRVSLLNTVKDSFQGPNVSSIERFHWK